MINSIAAVTDGRVETRDKLFVAVNDGFGRFIHYNSGY